MPIQFPDEQDKGAASGSGGKYLNLSKLKNRAGDVKQVRVRPLMDFLAGVEGWDTTNKPHRDVDEESLAAQMAEKGAKLRVEKDKKNPKPFRANFVANITDNAIQAWVCTQMSVYWAMKDLMKSEEWGANGDYDFLVTYTEKDGKVTYTTAPCKPSPLPAELAAEWAKVKSEAVGLDALFHGGDPFEPFGGK